MANAIRQSSVRFSARYSFSSFGIGVAEPQPLLDMMGGLAETLGDLLRRVAGFGQLGEGLELVRRVHGQPDRVGGEARFQSVVLGPDLAGHGVIGGQLSLRLQGFQTPPGGGRRR